MAACLAPPLSLVTIDYNRHAINASWLGNCPRHQYTGTLKNSRSPQEGGPPNPRIVTRIQGWKVPVWGRKAPPAPKRMCSSMWSQVKIANRLHVGKNSKGGIFQGPLETPPKEPKKVVAVVAPQPARPARPGTRPMPEGTL